MNQHILISRNCRERFPHDLTTLVIDQIDPILRSPHQMIEKAPIRHNDILTDATPNLAQSGGLVACQPGASAPGIFTAHAPLSNTISAPGPSTAPVPP
jgi:hypothetical protein